jgi:hypothetical protein
MVRRRVIDLRLYLQDELYLRKKSPYPGSEHGGPKNWPIRTWLPPYPEPRQGHEIDPLVLRQGFDERGELLEDGSSS